MPLPQPLGVQLPGDGTHSPSMRTGSNVGSFGGDPDRIIVMAEKGREIIEITLVETAFASGRSFELGARAG